ncbi:MAG: hypothetical protein R3C56_40490 [Pirellulaceae bacterium]
MAIADLENGHTLISVAKADSRMTSFSVPMLIQGLFFSESGQLYGIGGRVQTEGTSDKAQLLYS